ncbi:putative Histone acetyltransferase subunit NuA4 [Monocercomonoides exilis]|uniref:putative Histone acetyltransferase subunit NuA4 n=1 Tax=Monocercomonoides exilis TaxID=2049356 RepID=UPI00355A6F7F|nr:putative Histone acetyltransferase subunit NuA4 [Monocercomonoides exilis]|eukprot:MONOS_10336.1-p1 / transcript=MONOS_10336.1 / gene=MONOS_10336 / organism=Monocercomonoides_exilis_PA203 / gene_product=unspecified product / transcript_product=unspecified product / location=Mono_scaffold00465:43118-43541(+) / protein_length=107 / sequence_SO=supercontig / SO=protein_coding / is_pseudo=false
MERSHSKKAEVSGTELQKIRDILNRLEDRLRKTKKGLEATERALWKAEESYLEDTAAMGNIVKGFDRFRGKGTSGHASGKVRLSDRIFSQSSLTNPYPVEYYPEAYT